MIGGVISPPIQTCFFYLINLLKRFPTLFEILTEFVVNIAEQITEEMRNFGLLISYERS